MEDGENLQSLWPRNSIVQARSKPRNKCREPNQGLTEDCLNQRKESRNTPISLRLWGTLSTSSDLIVSVISSISICLSIWKKQLYKLNTNLLIFKFWQEKIKTDQILLLEGLFLKEKFYFDVWRRVSKLCLLTAYFFVFEWKGRRSIQQGSMIL